jgi:protein-disulfide isomerase
MSEGTITIKKNDLYKYSTFLLLALVIVLVIVMVTGDNGSVTGNVVANNPPAAAQPSAAQAVDLEIDVEGRSFKGAEDASVTIVEYSSFSCGFCNRVRPTLDQILETYPGEIKIVYKHFDRGGTDSSTAQATECAGDQGKFWEMHDAIFDGGSSGDLSAYADNIGLDVNEFEECLNSGKYAQRVQQDTQEARSAGGRGTPFFVINDKPLSGAQPFSAFKQVIDAELA